MTADVCSQLTHVFQDKSFGTAHVLPTTQLTCGGVCAALGKHSKSYISTGALAWSNACSDTSSAYHNSTPMLSLCPLSLTTVPVTSLRVDMYRWSIGPHLDAAGILGERRESVVSIG